MEKEFIPYKLALALKELGFDEPCFKGYTEEYKTLISFGNTHTNTSVKNALPTKPFTAPLYQQAFRWFREKYELWQIIQQNTDKDWTYDIMPIIGMIDYKLFDVFDTYEEAELECLKKLIEIVKQKK